MKLLIADDELSTRVFLRHCTAQWGYEAVEAADGLEAVSLLRGPDPPRIAVIDWMMPGMDGVEICARLNDEEQHGGGMIYTILLTSRSDKEDVMHALDHGAHDFLSKPVHIGELRSRISVGRRLVEAHSRLVDINRLKDRFLRIAAHDLRNPLGYIISMTELLTDESFAELRSEQDIYLRNIHESASAMQGLINDLLDMSALHEGTFKLAKQSGSISELVRNSAKLQQQTAKNKKVVLAERIADLPQFSFDQARIRQAVDNLLANAVRFSPPGSTVTLSVEAASHEVKVAVADQGPGLNSEDKANLFAEFGPPVVKSTGGRKQAGFGLALVKKIVEAHDGIIWAENGTSCGSIFCFTLPMAGGA
jgi:signal transduction histidine kinase